MCCLGSWVLKRETRRKRLTHEKSRTFAQTGDLCFSQQSRGGMLQKRKAGRSPQSGGWLAEPTWQATRRYEVSEVGPKPKSVACGATWRTSWNGFCSALSIPWSVVTP